MKRGRSNLSKTVRRGEPIVMIIPSGSAVNARVWRCGSKGRVTGKYHIVSKYYFGNSPSPTTRTTEARHTVRRRDEGQTWVRGWEGEAADALRALAMLS